MLAADGRLCLGPITSLAFRATMEEPDGFATSKSVGSHRGMTPRIHRSGEMDRSGQISKQGDGMIRHLLYEAAPVLMMRSRQPSKLRW